MSTLFRHPDGYMNTDASMKRCSRCGSEVAETSVFEDVALMANPPRQVERYVKVTRWQCLRFEEHAGEYRLPVATRPGDMT